MATLEHHQHHVGTGLDPLSRVGREYRRSATPQRCEQSIGLGRFEETVLCREILRLGERRHQTEYRVDGGMVQLHTLAEIGLAHIHGRDREAASYGDEQRRREQQQDRKRKVWTTGFLPLGHPTRPAPQRPHEQRGIGHDKKQNHHRLPHRDTGHGIGRRGQIEERRSIDAESPEAVEHRIAQGDGRDHCGYQHEVGPEHRFPPRAPQIDGNGSEQSRQSRNIGRRRVPGRAISPPATATEARRRKDSNDTA